MLTILNMFAIPRHCNHQLRRLVGKYLGGSTSVKRSLPTFHQTINGVFWYANNQFVVARSIKNKFLFHVSYSFVGD